MINLLLISLLVFSFLGCNKKSDENSNKDDEIFTITHKATENEEVIIYLYEKTTAPTRLANAFGFSTYKLMPSECLKLSANQFNKLIVRIGVGASIVPFMPLTTERICWGRSKKCVPSNYEILNFGNWSDKFRMAPVDHPNTNKNCINIKEWMDSKQE